MAMQSVTNATLTGITAVGNTASYGGGLLIDKASLVQVASLLLPLHQHRDTLTYPHRLGDDNHDKTASEKQDFSRTYLAHHELERSLVVSIPSVSTYPSHTSANVDAQTAVAA